MQHKKVSSPGQTRLYEPVCPQEMKIHRSTLNKMKLAKMNTSKDKKKKSLGLNSRVIPGLSIMLFISEEVINTSWLIQSVPNGRSSIILVLQQGIMKKKKKKDKLTCPGLHPKSMAEPLRVSEDYAVIVPE